MQNNVIFSEEINRAQHQAMSEDNNMLSIGLGINDPKGIFGTTLGLAEEFGQERVFDMPTAENAMTGIGIGACIAGSRVLMTHQRLDFFLLAMDQLVNNAAKWHYMFNGQMKVPLTIRLIIGRGWGQGPTHAQNLQAWFSHIPGLKVVVASRTENVANQLYQAIMDDNPVIFIEHRWLHNQAVDAKMIRPIEEVLISTQVVRKGQHITIVANSFMLLEVLRAAKWLQLHGIECDVIDTTCMHDIDWSIIYNSVKKTGAILVCDSARKAFSCGAEIVANVSENVFHYLKYPPIYIGLPDYPEPTSFEMTKPYYIDANSIVEKVCYMLGHNEIDLAISETQPKHDVPGTWFVGPF